MGLNKISVKKTIWKLFVMVLVGLSLPAISFGAMSSANYYIYADSVDSGGGWNSGGVYALSDTLGEGGVGISSSSVYQVRAGYQAMERGNLTLLLSSNSIDLGTLSAASVSSASIVATVNTNSLTGYTLSVGSTSGASLSDVSDGAVDGVGSAEEYGLAVSGADGSFGDDRAVSAGLVLASSARDANYTPTTITFKAKAGGSSVGGTYSQSVLLNLAANI